MISAVFFDFGGVILSSPFEAFERYETRLGIETGTIRGLNTINPDDNAWARLERGEVDVATFVAQFEAEALAAGFQLDGTEVIACLQGEIRPEMVHALSICSNNMTTALLTNNFISGNPEWASGGHFGDLLGHFDFVVESSVVGYRKPEPEFYRIALDLAGVDPNEVVFLDDLGINLRPARDMGMTTIKVVDPYDALIELESVTGLDLIAEQADQTQR